MPNNNFMEKFDEHNFEDSEVFKAADKELKDLVRKANGNDDNLTPVEQKRRRTLWQILNPQNKDEN